MEKMILGFCSKCKTDVVLTKKEIRLDNDSVIITYSGVCPECGKDFDEELL